MAVFARLRAMFRLSADNNEQSVDPLENSPEEQKGSSASANKIDEESRAELPSQDIQRGVQDVEAVTLSWSKASLIAVFAK
jgi:hypothetical protein